MTIGIDNETRRWLVFSLAASLFLLSQFYRVSSAVIAPLLLEDLALDTQAIGLLSASFFYAFALTQIPISLLLDNIGSRRMMTVLSIIGVVGALIFSVADSLETGVAGRVLLGIGMSCNLMGSYKLLTLWFHPRMFATLAGILVALGTMGNMVATTPLVLLVDWVGWRVSFQLIALINLVLTISFFAVVRDRPTGADSASRSTAALLNTGHGLANLKRLFRSKEYWIISLSTFTRYGIFAAFQALWAGPYLMEVVGLPALATGNLILILNVGMISGASCWGALSDRLFRTRKWLIVAGTLGMAVSIVLLSKISLATPLAAQVALFFCFGFFNSAGLLMYPHIKDLVPAGMSGAAMTGINFFTMIGPAVFLQGLGTLMQTLYPEASRGAGAFSAAFSVCIVSLVAISLLYCITNEQTAERNR